MLLKNLASMMVYDCKDNIEKAHNSSKNKYEYKANMSCVISLIDDYIIKLFYSISNEVVIFFYRIFTGILFTLLYL